MQNAPTRNTQTTATVASVALLLLLSPCRASADDHQQFGVGAATDANSIYFPIRLPGLMVEPMYYYYKNERGYPDGSGFYELNKTIVLGVGIFAVSALDDVAKVETYWGVRVGAILVNTEEVFMADNTVVSRQDDEYAIIYEPTLGVQYFLTPRFSVAANVSFMFQEGSVDVTANGQSYTPYDHSFSATQAKVIVRGYFN